MPKNKNALIRYKVINNLLSGGKTATKQQIAGACAEALYSDGVSLRTVENDIQAMRYDEGLGYFAPITYDHEQRAYFYEESGYSIDRLPLDSDDLRKLKLAATLLKQYSKINTFSDFSGTIDKVIRLINYSKMRLESPELNFIEFEKNPTTSGMEFIDQLIPFIQNQRVIKIEHQAFGQNQATGFTVHPYYLKEYKGRWYLVGWCEERENIRIFGLERIRSIEGLTLKPFTQRHFNPDVYFEKFIGVNVPAGKPEEIILRFKNDVGKYIETQPLHASQKLVSQLEYTHDFSYFLAVNHEFIGLVLSWQEHVEVVRPEWLRKQISETIGKMGEQYQNS